MDVYNFTITTTTTKYDYFQDIFDDQTWNISMFVLYSFGFVNCISGALISWFEKTGRAGPYRTLRNQLMSYAIDQMVFRYSVPGFIFNLRAIIGPLPIILCKFVTILNVWNGMNVALLLFSTTATKFVFIFWFRSIPVMDDDFLAFFINFSINFLSILGTLSKVLLQPTPTTVEVSAFFAISLESQQNCNIT